MTPLLALPSELTIYTVGETKPHWLAWLNAARDASAAGAEALICQVDAAAVDEVDGAGVQLLLALSNALASAHLSLRLTDPSGPLVAACNALGAAHLFGTPEAGGADA